MKKVKSKKPVQKKGSKVKPKSKTGTSKNKFADAFERWKSSTPMTQLAKEMGEKRRVLKRAFIKLAGGKDKFTELRESGAGGKAFGGKRSSGRTREAIVADDSKVPVLKSADIKMKRTGAVVKHMQTMHDSLDEQLKNDHKLTDAEKKRLYTGLRNATRILKQEKSVSAWKGWRCEHYQGRYGTQLRLIAPDKKTYVRAAATERADFIVVNDIGRTRYKHEKEARAARVAKQEIDVLKQGKEALKRKRNARKQKRAARKRAA